MTKSVLGPTFVPPVINLCFFLKPSLKVAPDGPASTSLSKAILQPKRTGGYCSRELNIIVVAAVVTRGTCSMMAPSLRDNGGVITVSPCTLYRLRSLCQLYGYNIQCAAGSGSTRAALPQLFRLFTAKFSCWYQLSIP